MRYRPKLSLTQKIAIVGGLTSSLIGGGCNLTRSDLLSFGARLAGTQVDIPLAKDALNGAANLAEKDADIERAKRGKYTDANVDIYRDKGLSRNRIAEERAMRNLEDEFDQDVYSQTDFFTKPVGIHFFYLPSKHCKKMEEILEDLQEKYPGLEVNSYNYKDRDRFLRTQNRLLAKKWRIRVIPTIIFNNPKKVIVGVNPDSLESLEREIRRRSRVSKKSESTDQSQPKEKNQPEFVKFSYKIKGKKVVIKANIQNPLDRAEEYRLFLYDQNDKLLDKEPDIYWLDIDSNETNTLTALTNLEYIANGIWAEVKTQKGGTVAKKSWKFSLEPKED